MNQMSVTITRTEMIDFFLKDRFLIEISKLLFLWHFVVVGIPMNCTFLQNLEN